MALKDDVINSFFNQSKAKKPSPFLPPHNKNHTTNKETSSTKKQYKNYKVFDNPPDQRQSQDKLKTKPRQTQNKAKTNLRQKNKTQDKGETEPKTQGETNLRQTWDKIEKKVSFSSLVGLQRNIILFLYEACKASREKTTPSLSVEHIAFSCKTTKSSAQKTIQRLEKKTILKRAEFKNGRGGWTKYELPEYIYQEILHDETQDKLKTNLRQTWDKHKSEPRTQPETSPSSSSCNYINTTTTGNTLVSNKETQLSTEWLDVDIEPLSFIGFTKTHLFQIASQNKLLPQIAQDSIYSFSFDLQENNKARSIKGDPINFFMGILRNGKPYTPPGNYESPQDKAMRLYMERKKKIEQGRFAIEKEAKDLAYNEWFSKLTDDQKRKYLPENLRRGARIEKNKMLEGSARNYFKNEIWPDLKRGIIQKKDIVEDEEVIEKDKKEKEF